MTVEELIRPLGADRLQRWPGRPRSRYGEEHAVLRPDVGHGGGQAGRVRDDHAGEPCAGRHTPAEQGASGASGTPRDEVPPWRRNLVHGGLTRPGPGEGSAHSGERGQMMPSSSRSSWALGLAPMICFTTWPFL